MFNRKLPGGRPTLGGFQRIAWTVLLIPCLIQVNPVGAACTRQWAAEPNLNVARHAHGACVTPCGDIYVVGGRSGGANTRSVERLDFDGAQYATSWQQLSDMPAPARLLHALVCTSGFIYVIGGHDGTTPIANVDRYDILNDSWSTVAIPALSLARTNAAAVVDRWGRIWVVGGNTDNSGTTTGSVEIFDPGRPVLGWVSGPAMNVPRNLHGLVVDPKGTIWALGGSSGSSHVNSIESIDACGAVAWTTSASVIPNPVSQTDYGVLGADGQVYVAGGWLPGMSNRVLRFDPVTTLWETCQALNQPMNHVRLVLGLNNRVYRIGGEPSPGSSIATVESLDTGQFCAPSGVPAISAAGLAVFSLLILAAGTVVMRARRSPSGADRL